MNEYKDESEVFRLISRFANSFDLKSWEVLEECLAEKIYTDYSDLRGTPPETISRRRFVELRCAALDGLCTHHLAGNYEVNLMGDCGECRVSMVIYRRSEGSSLDTHCIYFLKVSKVDDFWKISAITQKVLWSEGNPAIHKGISKGQSLP